MIQMIDYKRKLAEAAIKASDSGKKSFKPDVLLKGYSTNDYKNDDAYHEINRAAYQLEECGYFKIQKVNPKATGAAMIKRIDLILDKIDELAKLYNLTQKSNTFDNVKKILNEYTTSEHEMLASFAKEQMSLVEKRKYPKYMQKDDYSQLEMLLKAANFMFDNQENIYIRTASLVIFHDSKKFEGKVVEHLFEVFGEDFASVDDMLNYHHIFRTTPMVRIKGNAKIVFKDGREWETTFDDGDVGFGEKMVAKIDRIETNNVLSIENITPFADFRHHDFDGLLMFCSGFANNLNIEFLKKTTCPIYHSGDLDANGFRIMHDLERRVNRKVKPYLMGLDDAKKWIDFGQKLSDCDKMMFPKMIESEEYTEEEKEVFEFLLDNGKFIEQEKIV